VTCPTGGSEAVRYAIDIINKESGIPKQIILRSHKIRPGYVPSIYPADGGKTKQKRDMIRVGYAQIDEESNWRKASIESIQKAAKEFDVDLTVEFNVLSIEDQMAQVRKLIAEDMDVIVISPLVAEGWQDILEEAGKAQIPVLLVDRTVSIDEELYQSYIGADFEEEGRRCARWLLQNTSHQFQVSILELRGTEGASPTQGRKDGFESVISEYGTYQIVASECGDFNREGGAQIVRNYLRSHEWDIDAIYAHNDEMALGAIEVLKEYGIKPGIDVKIMSVDGTADALTALKKGEINCVVECNPLLGPELMKAITDLMQGKELPLRIITDEIVFTEETPEELFRNRKY
ncbi:MAG: substrate-binding domain-containing protein, partial [Lachnospiraceae bacterium]|nr:substrate-binding domain-containing protein [Lachnospiraceae bacterium]